MTEMSKGFPKLADFGIDPMTVLRWRHWLGAGMSNLWRRHPVLTS